MSTLMNLIAIKLPPARITLSGKALELLDALFGIVSARQLLQIVANQLIQTDTQGLRFFARSGDGLLIKRKSNVHFTQYMCTLIMCQWR